MKKTEINSNEPNTSYNASPHGATWGGPTEIQSCKANTDCIAVQHVAPAVEPTPPKWPPAWLAAQNPPPEAPRRLIWPR